MKVQYLWCQTLSSVSVCGQGYPSTPIPPLGLSPHRPLGTTSQSLAQKEEFPTHGPWDREVCEPATGLTAVRRGATLAMVTWPDKVLGWLSGLSQPTAKWMAHMGAGWFGLDSTEVQGGRCARLC